MKTMWILLLFALLFYGCQTPYSGTLGPEGFNGWIESEADGFVCLWNGFDRICIRTIEGPQGEPGKDGADGRDGADGQIFIAIKEVPVEVIIQEIVYETVTEYIDREILIPVVEERIVTEFVDREIPVTVFVERVKTVIQEVIAEVPIEVPIYIEVPGETKTVYVEVEKIIEVPGETVYVEVPGETVYVEVVKEIEVERLVEVVRNVYTYDGCTTFYAHMGDDAPCDVKGGQEVD